MRSKLEKYFYEYNLVTQNQHGFVRCKSCTTNLLETLDFISGSLSSGYPVDVIYLDFAKAFDTVPHRRLLLKLERYGVKGKLLKWIESFLSNRAQRVTLKEFISAWRAVISGVPQGSVIGPFLFVVFINDLTDCFRAISKLYADDTKLLSKLESSNSSEYLQEDLDRACVWATKWLLGFNVDKCITIHYGVNNPGVKYFMNQVELKESSSERDLGVIFSSDLKWKNHVNHFNCLQIYWF